jgi:drug/metabolite transporter (DMT)-like permease
VSSQLQSQALGLSLAIATAIGCLAYERLVKNFSFFVVSLFVIVEYVPMMLIAAWTHNTFAQDFQKFGDHKLAIITFMASGVTCPLWYFIVRKQSVMVGATYEFKYIVILTLFYVLFGTSKLSWNLLVGIVLAVLSVWFVSKA